MGAAPSTQTFFEKADGSEAGGGPAADAHIKAVAGRWAAQHGLDTATLEMGLAAIEPCVQGRIGRRITKKLDLACLRTFKAELRGEAKTAPDVAAALGGLPPVATSPTWVPKSRSCARPPAGRSLV